MTQVYIRGAAPIPNLRMLSWFFLKAIVVLLFLGWDNYIISSCTVFLRFLWGLLTFKRDSLFDNGSVCLIFWILFGEHLSVKYKRGYGFTIAKCGTSHNYSA